MKVSSLVQLQQLAQERGLGFLFRHLGYGLFRDRGCALLSGSRQRSLGPRRNGISCSQVRRELADGRVLI